MSWGVRVESPANAAVTAFLDGVTAGLLAVAGLQVAITDGSGDRRVDVEFSVRTKRQAVALAKGIAAVIELHGPRVCITLTCDVPGGAS